MTVFFDTAHSQRAQAGLLSLIALLHIGALWALTSGTTVPPLSQPAKIVSAFMVQAAPAASVVSEPIPVAPQSKPAPPPPKPRPKPKPRVKPKPQAVKPAITMPAEQAMPAPEPVSAPEPVPAPEPVAAAPAHPAPAAPRPTEGVRPGQAPITASPAPAQPKTITSGVQYLDPPSPRYPRLSRRMQEEGKVVLRVLINELGRPDRIDVQQSSGSARLDRAAQEAVQRARFQPHIENGQAIAVFATVPIVFKLDI